jgi:hypothetical protein
MSGTKKGGFRKGSGAKLKYGEETKTVSFRVPKSKVMEVKKVVNDLLNNYKTACVILESGKG